MKKKLLFLLLVCAHATTQASMYGAEITFQKISDLTFSFKLTLYVENQNDVTSLGDKSLLNYGDGITDTLFKTNQLLTDSLLFIYKVDFEGIHTYADTGTYLISYSLSNRPENVLNINGGNSVNEPMFVEDSLFIRNPDIFSFDYASSFTHYQTDIGFDGYALTHNSKVNDLNADSITYKLVSPLKGDLIPVTNYILPNLVAGSPAGQTFSISDSGIITWKTPVFYGLYCVAIKATAWRSGMKMETITRDMMIVFDAFTSTQEVDSIQNDLAIFPNPAGDWLQFKGYKSKVGEVEIIDAMGRTVVYLNNVPASINVSSLLPGIYFLQLKSEHQTTNKKFSKN